MSTIMEILDYEHEQILLEDQIRRLQDEHRFAMPGCGYDCWDGWHEIIFNEFGPLDLIPLPDPAVIILPHGLILIACECNSTKSGGVRHYPDWFEQMQNLR